MVYVPLFVHVVDVDSQASLRDRMAKVMTILQGQYDAWFAKRGLPFAMVLDPLAPQQNPNPYVPNVTNLGILDKDIPRVLGSDTGRSLEINDMKFGLRLVHASRM